MFEQITGRVQAGHIRLARLDRIADHRLGVVFHLDQIQGGGGDLARLGCDDRHGIADIADALADPDQHRPVVNNQTVIVLAGDIGGGQDGARHRATAGLWRHRCC